MNGQGRTPGVTFLHFNFRANCTKDKNVKKCLKKSKSKVLFTVMFQMFLLEKQTKKFNAVFIVQSFVVPLEHTKR